MFKKSKLLALLLSLVFLAGLSFNGAAINYDLVGGSFYTTLQLTDLNNAIENYNESIKDIEQEGDITVTKMDKMNSAFGFYGGTGLNMGRNLTLGATFESFSAGTGTEISGKDEHGEVNLDLGIDLAVNGLVTTLNSDINEYIGLSGGAGYYYGTVSMSASISATGDYANYIQDQSFSDSASVSGFGFKAGGTLNYPLSRRASLYSAVHYRMLTLKTEAQNSLTNDAALNANGVEMRVGITYRF
ncbi:hypothetical protein K9M06_01965 [Candidatus Bipolaricaulota bacterium]|nr:hypothetical protein [Candidatus Bipolaricaulota bacterium]